MEKTQKITKVNKSYFQKSLFFIYPLLSIPKKYLPQNTYLIAEDINVESRILICEYRKFQTADELKFESQYILSHPAFKECKKLENGELIYLFSFEDIEYKSFWNLFLEGKYSLFSSSAKKKILSFYKEGTTTKEYIMSYLYPEKFYSEYAELLNVSVDTLKEIGELIDKPNLKKETLNSLLIK